MSFYSSSGYPVTFRPADREPSKHGFNVTYDGFYYYEPDIMFEPRLSDHTDGEESILTPEESAQLFLWWNTTPEGSLVLENGKTNTQDI